MSCDCVETVLDPSVGVTGELTLPERIGQLEAEVKRLRLEKEGIRKEAFLETVDMLCLYSLHS